MAVPERNRQRTKEKPTAKFRFLIRIKSIIQSAVNSIAPLFQIYKRFCQETTLHGLKHTVANNLHWFERVLWFILTMSAFFGAVYCGLSQLTRYNSEPVVVSLQRDYRNWWTTFPAVTACFMDRVDPSRAREAIEDLWNVTEETDPDKYKYYYNFVELVSDVSFRINLQNFWKFQADDTVNEIDLLQLSASVHPIYPIYVIVEGEVKLVQWVPVMTEMGMCMTFNSLYSRYQFLLDESSWKAEKMHKCHYHSGQCFVRIESPSSAVRFFIHSPHDIPTAISNPTGEVSLGEELILDFKTVEIQAAPAVKLLSPEQRRCRYPDEWLSDNIKAYSYGLCQMHCRNRMSAMFCGCRPFFHVIGDGEVCNTQGMACIGRNVEILINLPKDLAKCSCMPQCSELNYYSHTKKVVFRKVNESDAGGGAGPLAVVRINLLPPKFRMRRDVLFTLEDLFGVATGQYCIEQRRRHEDALQFIHRKILMMIPTIDGFHIIASLGGTTALFVGASVLTVVETALFLLRCTVDLLIWVLTRKRGKKAVAPIIFGKNIRVNAR